MLNDKITPENASQLDVLMEVRKNFDAMYEQSSSIFLKNSTINRKDIEWVYEISSVSNLNICHFWTRKVLSLPVDNEKLFIPFQR